MHRVVATGVASSPASRKRKWSPQSLGFPPLPVMVVLGEHYTGKMLSSFDLLQMIEVDTQGAEEEPAPDKAASIQRMQQNIAALYQECGGKTAPDDWTHVQLAYESYCAGFRAYVRDHYPACTYEFCFYPLAAVAPDSLIVRQGLSRCLSSSATGGDGFASYSSMLRAYALEHAALTSR